MGEDNSKWSNWQTTNLENIQSTPTAQLQKNKWPNQKMGQRLEKKEEKGATEDEMVGRHQQLNGHEFE